MRHAGCWLVLSILFLQECHATSIVWVVSARGDYIVLAADSRAYNELKHEANDCACKAVVFDDYTVFFTSGRPRVPVNGGTPWDSIQTAWDIYKSSKDRDTQSLSTAWGKRAKDWFDGQNPAFVKSLTGADGTLVQGGFINFVPNANPIVFLQELVFDGSPLSPAQLFLRPSSESMDQIGATGIDNRELVGEFIEAKTPRALKAYGKLKPHNIGKELSQDKEFVIKAVQFVIDNVPDSEKPFVHGPIDVVVVRRDGVHWGPRKDNCFSEDYHSPKKSSKTSVKK